MLEFINITKVLDENLPIYAEVNYSDPPLKVETWCTIPDQGFRVCRFSLGTQTGTHIDAQLISLLGENRFIFTRRWRQRGNT